MKLFVVICLLGVALGDKLDNTYLPPSNARTAGGSNFLSAPFGSSFTSGGSSFRSYNQKPTYSTPSNFGFARGSAPSPVYGVPGHHQDNIARTSYNSRPINILRFSNENNGDGSYRFDYETENRISQHEVGQLQNVGSQHDASAVRGSYSYQSPDGQVLTVDYVADENGFRPSGQHLPTPPPIPEAIQRSLEQNAAEEAAQGHRGYSGSSGDAGYQYNAHARTQSFNNGGYRY